MQALNITADTNNYQYGKQHTAPNKTTTKTTTNTTTNTTTKKATKTTSKTSIQILDC
jgi:hypothetical protein